MARLANGGAVRPDHAVVGLLQHVYDKTLDHFETRIATFSMLIAPIAVRTDTLAPVLRGCSITEMPANGSFPFGIGLFYDVRMMVDDDKLQTRHDPRAVHVRSPRFRVDVLHLRVLHPISLTTVALLHHTVAGLGLLAIVYARFLLIWERARPEVRRGALRSA